MNEEEKIKQLISAYVDGELSQEEKREAEDLILNDRAAQRYYKELTRLSATLPQWENEDISPDLSSKIQKALLEKQINKENKKMKTSSYKIPVGGGVVATLALFVIVGIFVLRPGGIYQTSYYPKYEFYDQTQRETPARFSSVDQLAKDAEKRNFKSKEDRVGAGGVVATGPQETVQHEPYYLTTQFNRVFSRPPQTLEGNEQVAQSKPAAAHKSIGGFQQSRYDGSALDADGKLGASENKEKIALFGNKRAGYHAGLERGASSVRGEVSQKNGRDYVTITRSSAERINVPVNAAAPQSEYWADADDEGDYYTVEEAESFRRARKVLGDDYFGYEQQRTDTEEYERIYENHFVNARYNPLSTFSIDVDTAAYSNVRRFLNNNQLPPVDAVRIEEMINYFDYNYPKPRWGQPFSVTTKGAVCPWNPNHFLVKVGLQGAVPQAKQIPPANLVFLIDVSGSMNQPNKLPLLKEAFKMMVNQLRADERVAIVVYSGSARLWLDSTPGSQKQRILSAIDRLRAGGSTAGEAGLKLAYQIARDNFIRRGNNRVVLATDGDFNVGVSSDHELVRLIEQRRNDGVFLSILGFGTGNLKDAKMEKIADHGNGTYYYIDDIEEGQKVLVDELGSTLLTIAKDVKIQVEFNPEHVRAYKLIGYENRLLAKEDFNNDRVDAGELGAGHTVTALYEVVPNVAYREHADVDGLIYQKRRIFRNDEIMTVKLRYKHPNGFRSKLIKQKLRRSDIQSRPRGDFAFAASVAEFGMLLRNSPTKGYASYDHVIQEASRALGQDAFGHRREFIDLVNKARGLDYRAVQTPHPHPYYETTIETYPDHSPQRQFKGE